MGGRDAHLVLRFDAVLDPGIGERDRGPLRTHQGVAEHLCDDRLHGVVFGWARTAGAPVLRRQSQQRARPAPAEALAPQEQRAWFGAAPTPAIAAVLFFGVPGEEFGGTGSRPPDSGEGEKGPHVGEAPVQLATGVLRQCGEIGCGVIGDRHAARPAAGRIGRESDAAVDEHLVHFGMGRAQDPAAADLLNLDAIGEEAADLAKLPVNLDQRASGQAERHGRLSWCRNGDRRERAQAIRASRGANVASRMPANASGAAGRRHATAVPGPIGDRRSMERNPL